MKAAFVKAPFEIDIRDIPTPEVAYGTALLRVEYVGVCGSDLHLAKAWAKDWTRFGHETVARVVEVGEGIDDLEEGELVAVRATRMCGTCHFCMAGEPAYCLDWKKTRLSIGLSEYLVAPRASIWKVHSIDPRSASLIEPLAVALDVVNSADIQLGDTVCVIGPGPIGIMAARLAKLRGARRLLVSGTATDQARMRLAVELGADEMVVGTEGDALATAARELSRGRGIDRVIVTAPPVAIPQALEITRYGGVISFVGFSADDDGAKQSIDLNKLHASKQQLRGPYASPVAPFSIANDLIADGLVPADKLLTHEYGLDDLRAALLIAESHEDSAIKATVRVAAG